LYNQDGINASLLGRYIGTRFGASGNTVELEPLFTLDLSAGYNLGQVDGALRDTSIQVQLDNLTDVRKVINFAGTTVGAGTPLFWTQPGRSVFVNVTTTLY